MENFDLVFIGSGPGGYIGAIRGAQRGSRVAVVERDVVGGVCLNWGCIPTKTLVASSNLLRMAADARSWGLKLDGVISPDLEAIWARKNKIVDNLTKGILSLFKSHGVTLIKGGAKIVAPGLVTVGSGEGTKEIKAGKIIIATGSRPASLPGMEPDGRIILTSSDMLANPYVPKSLLIVGAGAVGMEFAGIFAALGSAVTVVEMLPKALPNEDDDVSELITREFKKQKIKIITSAKIEKLEKTGGGVKAQLSGGSAVEAERMLVSVGRAFNTGDLGLDSVGISLGKRGEIPVNRKMETAAGGIYAVGDVVGGPLLAHVAGAGALVATENATGGNRLLDLSNVPACTFTHPEVASVGLKERQAKELGIEIRVGRFPVRALGMAQAMGEIAGEVKVVADSEWRVLGVHVVGPQASSVIHEAALAVNLKLKVDEWVSTIHAHPSMSEALVEAAEDVIGMAIHLPKPKK